MRFQIENEEQRKERTERANKLVNELANEGMSYTKAENVLRTALDELFKRKNESTIKII